jgi:predicted RNA-binding protein YlxR (DUF448 family)
MAVRTCVVSRARLSQDQLVRLGLDDSGALCVRGAGPGRSAWVQPIARILRKLEEKPGMARRSLRQTPSHADGLVDVVADHLATKLAASLRRAWRSGTVREAAVCPIDALAFLKPWGAVVGDPREYVLPWDGAGVAGILGRARIQNLSVFDSRPSRALLHDLRRWHGLGYAPAPKAASLN